MNKKYSQINYPAYTKMRKLKKNDYDSCIATMNMMLDYSKKIYIDSEGKDFGIYEASLIKTFLTNEDMITHYFIKDSNLYEFFKETEIKKETYDNIGSMITNIVKNEYMDGISGKYEKGFASIGVFHSKKIDRSILFFIGLDSTLENGNIICSNGDDVFVRPFGKFYTNKKEKLESSSTNILDIVINMIFYIHAFPKNVLNKAPSDVKAKHIKKISTITQTSFIKNYSIEKSSHLRSGHFRYLSSDYYKNKKGQTIYIEPVFVNGKAKTIISEVK